MSVVDEAAQARLREAARVAREARLIEELRLTEMVRRVTTPEGAVIRLKVASFTERMGAFLIDVGIQWAIVIATLFGLMSIANTLGEGVANLTFGIWMVFYFFLRNFYYIFFETGHRAATPGKRALGLRVAARDGGRLTSNAVLARNFIREIEFGLPVQFLMMAGSGVEGWIGFFGLLWSGVFMLLPLFNRDRLRAGDLIAGTWVIHSPKTKLLGDISQAAVQAEGAVQRFAFTPEQIDTYGIHELHVLEDVLRSSAMEIKTQVAARIRHKIGWERQPNESDIEFLEAFYAAMRRRLEQRMLFGDRKTDKFDKR
jgi:uncharacterized RDD family membrane protein YckC